MAVILALVVQVSPVGADQVEQSQEPLSVLFTLTCHYAPFLVFFYHELDNVRIGFVESRQVCLVRWQPVRTCGYGLNRSKRMHVHSLYTKTSKVW
jgi:hypothetical protein